MSSQNSFLWSLLFRPFTEKCRRADIPDFSPYISHFWQARRTGEEVESARIRLLQS